MATDPRSFIVTDCDKGIQQNLVVTTQRNSFFNNLGKLGNIQAINSGGGKFSN